MHPGQQYRGHHRDRDHQLGAELRPARLRLIHLLLAQLIEEQPGIEAGPGTDGKRKAGMGQRADQEQVEQLGDHQGKNRNLYWRADVLLRIKARRQHFDHDNPEQTDRIGNQSTLGHGRIMGIELTILEQ
ncbi:hypothetical protein D3C76_1262950 [compost metagenome]